MKRRNFFKRAMDAMATPTIPVWYLAVILVGSFALAAILTWLELTFFRP